MFREFCTSNEEAKTFANASDTIILSQWLIGQDALEMALVAVGEDNILDRKYCALSAAVSLFERAKSQAERKIAGYK
jgi:hypothetical protein